MDMLVAPQNQATAALNTLELRDFIGQCGLFHTGRGGIRPASGSSSAGRKEREDEGDRKTGTGHEHFDTTFDTIAVQQWATQRNAATENPAYSCDFDTSINMRKHLSVSLTRRGSLVRSII
jgi:hypothetical protein